MRSTVAVPLLLALCLGAAAQQPASCPPPGTPCPACDPVLTGDPLAVLREGNVRFTTSGARHYHQSVSCAGRLACCQRPIAAILSCSDSRVPLEVLFDVGVGDLFVVREAGNVAPPTVLGSIEYAVDHLGPKVVVVMGHRRCGAVEAAFCPMPPPNIDSLWKLIRPAVPQGYKPKCEPHPEIDPAKWDEAIRKNVDNMAVIVEKDLIRIHRPDVKVVRAYYDLDSGKVEFPSK